MDLQTKGVPKLRKVPENPGYKTVHWHLLQIRGKAKDYDCADCGAPAAEWAFDNLEPYLEEKLKKRTVRYWWDTDRYKPLCRKCHAQHDMQKMCKNGLHAYVLENWYLGRKDGTKTCYPCKRIFGNLSKEQRIIKLAELRAEMGLED